jgi:RimJ/RimL family protein N-acetyltransferase
VPQHRAGPVVLVAVRGPVLDELVRAATTGASADDVTPPLTPGGTWTDVRTDWLRRFHEDRSDGLAGDAQEATWAVVVDGRVVGSVRLARTSDGVLETGAWLTSAARGRGFGRAALAAVLAEAASAGARQVRATTTTGNGAALAVLRQLGFACAPDADGRTVRAVVDLPGQGSAGTSRP